MNNGNKLLKNRKQKTNKKKTQKNNWLRNVILCTANFDNSNCSKRLMIKIKKEAIPCFPDFCPHKPILTFLAASSSVIMSAFLKSRPMLMRFFYFHSLMF